MRPIRLPFSVNQSAPSGPDVIVPGEFGTGNSVMAPAVVVRPIARSVVLSSVNHIAPSGPAVIEKGLLPFTSVGNSVIAPLVVILPIFPEPGSVNQRAPSGPAAIAFGWAVGVGIAKLVTEPAVVIRPILLLLLVNQSAPSGPVAMPDSPRIAKERGKGYSVMIPADVIRPTVLNSVNQTAPSGPAVIPPGEEKVVGVGNSASSLFAVGGVTHR
jgi:hypothetical protein